MPSADAEPSLPGRMRVLVVRDGGSSPDVMTDRLTGRGFSIVRASTAAEVRMWFALRRPDVIIAWSDLPAETGAEVCSLIRARTPTPVIAVAGAPLSGESVAMLLDAGADDVVAADVSSREIVARVRAVVRRSAVVRSRVAPSVGFGQIAMDFERREVRRSGAVVPLTDHEYRLLAELAGSPDTVREHAHLLDAVWGSAYRHETHYLRVYIRRLREKLEADPARPRHLLTEIGVGYRLRLASPDAQAG